MFSMFPNSIFSGLFMLVFALVAGFIIVAIVKNIAQWSKNNNSPVLTVSAKIIAKRTAVSSNNSINGETGVNHHMTSTTYYATFEVESGDRMELMVNGNEYGLLADGDAGRLTFQGTRYLSFERNR